MRKNIFIYLGLFMFTLISMTDARADVPPPNTFGCQNASENDACRTDNNKSGICVQETCSRLDYSNVDDAGTPGSKTYDCLVCTPKSSDEGCTTVPHPSKKSNVTLLFQILWQ